MIVHVQSCIEGRKYKDILLYNSAKCQFISEVKKQSFVAYFCKRDDPIPVNVIDDPVGIW